MRVLALLRRTETPTRKLPIDGSGSVLLVIWVGALQIMLDTGKDADWFSSADHRACLVAAVGFIAWLIWELNERHPIVDLSLFVIEFPVRHAHALRRLCDVLRQRRPVAALAADAARLHRHLGRAAEAPAGAVALLLSPWVGRNVTRFDPRIFASVAFVVMGTGLYTRSLLNSQAAFSDFMLPMVLQGAAMAFFFVSVISIQLDGLPPQRMPAATSISNFLRITAAAFTTSITTTLWDDRASLHRQPPRRGVEHLRSEPAGGARRALHGLGLNDQQSLGVLTRGLVEQSYLLSTLDYFYATTGSRSP